MDNSIRSSAILVVEDEFLLRADAADLLEDAGFRVLQAAGPLEALAILQDRAAEIGVLFTDIDLRGPIDGTALARHVAKRWPELHVLVTSGRTPVAPDGVPDGHFIGKPYHPEGVVAAIRALFGEPYPHLRLAL
jgi:DNA-binding NtrC family response regulator